MAKNWRELYDKLPPERKAAVEARAKQLLKEIDTPPHITQEWDENWNPICLPDCPACAVITKLEEEEGL